jgi:hypothetical protein
MHCYLNIFAILNSFIEGLNILVKYLTHLSIGLPIAMDLSQYRIAPAYHKNDNASLYQTIEKMPNTQV